jgi:hypothetical protein
LVQCFAVFDAWFKKKKHTTGCGLKPARSV